MVEVDRGRFSLEPFLFVGGALVTWADADVSQRRSRADGLPIPSSVWRGGRLRAHHHRVRGAADRTPVLCVRYRLASARAATLPCASSSRVRPFQVTRRGRRSAGSAAMSPIRELAWRDGAVWVNAVTARGRPAHAADGVRRRGVRAGRRSRSSSRAASCRARSAVSDAFGTRRARCASISSSRRARARGLRRGALRRARSRARRLRELRRLDRRGAARRGGTRRGGERLGRVSIRLARPHGDASTRCARRPRTSSSNRDGAGAPARAAALHALVDPRRRDDGGRAAARGLRATRSRDFVRWYAAYQAADGNVPCAVDRERARLARRARQPRRSSIFTVAEYFRFTRRPRVPRTSCGPPCRAPSTISRRCARTRLGPEFDDAEASARAAASCPSRRATRATSRTPSTPTGTTSGRCAGSATPPALPRALGDAAHEARFARLRDDARGECLYASIATTIARAADPVRPGLGRVGRLRPVGHRERAHDRPTRALRLPAKALAYTFDEYLAGLPPAHARRDRLGQLHAPTRSGSSARSCASAGAPTRTSCCDFCSPTAGRARGTSGRRSRGAIRGARATSATCRTRGSPPSTCSPCSALFAYERPSRRRARPRGGRPRRLARRRAGGRRRGPADLLRTAPLYARPRRRRRAPPDVVRRARAAGRHRRAPAPLATAPPRPARRARARRVRCGERDDRARARDSRYGVLGPALPPAAVAANQRVRRGVVRRAPARPRSRAPATMRCASTLPSSTPHWSNESMSQIAPCVNTLCS